MAMMKWLPAQPDMGVNLYDDPRSLKPGECRKAQNLVPLRSGVLEKRGGLARPFAQALLLGHNDDVPVAFHAIPISSVADFVVTTMGPLNGYFIGISQAGSMTASAELPFYNQRPHGIPWNGKIYLLPGPYAEWKNTAGTPSAPSQCPFYIFDASLLGPSSTPVTAVFEGTGNDAVYPAVAAPYKQRLVLMNFGRGYENTIVFTDNYSATLVGDAVLSVTGRAISLVAGADGDEIVAGIEVMLTNVGSPAESGLLILRKYGTPFLLTGDMDQTTGGTSTLDIKRISINTGCAGPYTVARTPHGIIWAGRDDVWAFDAGVLPRRIGQKIQPALKLTPTSLQHRWTAAYFDGFYRLAVYGEGQSLAASSAPGDQWWLDLDDGLPGDWREAQWWGPQQFLGGGEPATAPTPRTWGMVAESRAGKQPKLFYVDKAEIGIGAPGITVGEYGTGPRDLTAVVSALADHDYVDPEIQCELISREYALKPPYLQLHDGIMMSIKPNEDLGIETDFIVDDGFKTFSREKRVSSQGFRMGSSPTDDADETLHNKATRLAIYPGTRWAGSSNRFEFRDVAGYVIDSWNRYLVCQFREPSLSQWVATIATGVYTLTELMAALQTAINATRTGGNAWTVAQDPATGFIQFTASSLNSDFIGIAFSVQTPATGTTPTAAQAAASLRLAAYLALDTSNANTELSTSGPGTMLIEGRQALFQKASTNFELYGLQAQFEVYPRTP